jgi:hypothetical protein
MGDKGSSDIETANLQPVEKKWDWSADYAKKLAKDYQGWAKKQSKEDWKAIEPIFDKMTRMMEDTSKYSEEDRAYYDSIFKPWTEEAMTSIRDTQAGVDAFGQEIEKLKADAEAYGSEANQAFEAGRAQAAVATAMDKSTETAKNELLSYGVNPSAVQFGALTYGLEAAKGAEMAGAGTKAAMDTRATSREMFNEALDREATKLGLDINVDQLRKGLVDTGEGVATRALQGTELASNIGTQAGGLKLAQSELEGNQKVNETKFLDTLNSGLTGWGNMLNTADQNAIAEQQVANESSSGLGGFLGTLFSIGKSVAAPQTAMVAEGGAIPEELSPSAGGVEDDVPAMLTAGEFVFPKEAVDFYGAERLYKMRDKAIQGMTDFAAMDEAEQQEAIRETV